MSLRPIDIVLLVALAACVVITWTAGRDFSRPNVEFIPDMAHSVAYDAFAPNPNFPDGKTLQPPPTGTIPRDLPPLHFAATPEDAERAGRELHSPVALDDPRVLQRGAFVFASFCQHCHGPSGAGDGPVAKRGFPPPPSLIAEHARRLADGQLFHIVTYGQGNMPAHAGQLSRRDRWCVVAHVRALQREAPATTQSAPATQATAGEKRP